MACLTKYENSKDLLVHMNNENCFVKLPSLDNEFWKDPKYTFILSLIKGKNFLIFLFYLNIFFFF